MRVTRALVSREPRGFARLAALLDARFMSRRAWLLSFAIVAIAAAVLLAMGRNPICTCGAVDLWVGQRDSPRTSQMLLDWYSLSHVVHGMLFYAGLWLVARRWPVEWRFLAAHSDCGPRLHTARNSSGERFPARRSRRLPQR